MHFAPRQCHRFEYQTSIKATSLGLFELCHVKRKVGGTGQRILELLSQNIDGTEPVPVTLQTKTHVNVLLGNTNIFIYEERKYEEHALFRHCLQFHTVSGCRWRTTTSFPVLATERLQMKRWGLRALLKGMLMEIHEGFLFRFPHPDSQDNIGNKFSATCYCCFTFNQHYRLYRLCTMLL